MCCFSKKKKTPFFQMRVREEGVNFNIQLLLTMKQFSHPVASGVTAGLLNIMLVW
jgi:hypothetical protein